MKTLEIINQSIRDLQRGDLVEESTGITVEDWDRYFQKCLEEFDSWNNPSKRV